MSNTHSLDQFFCQRCQTMGCEKVLDMNMIKSLEEKLSQEQARSRRYRGALEKISKSTEVGDASAWIAKAALTDEAGA